MCEPQALFILEVQDQHLPEGEASGRQWDQRQWDQRVFSALPPAFLLSHPHHQPVYSRGGEKEQKREFKKQQQSEVDKKIANQPPSPEGQVLCTCSSPLLPTSHTELRAPAEIPEQTFPAHSTSLNSSVRLATFVFRNISGQKPKRPLMRTQTSSPQPGNMES